MRRRNLHHQHTGPQPPGHHNLHPQNLHPQNLHPNLHQRNLTGRPTAILQARVEGAVACSPSCLFCREVAGLPSELDLSRLSNVAAIAAELQHVMPDPQAALAIAVEIEAAAGLARGETDGDPVLSPGKEARILELE